MRFMNRASWTMFAVNFAFSFGMGLYGFVMPAYARQLGATPQQFGLMLSAAFAVGTLAVIPGGFWADRYDRRRLMIIGWAMCLPAPLFFAFAPDWRWLIPGYVFFFLSFFCNPAINAYVSGLAERRHVGVVWGVVNSAFPLGFIVGPVVGAFIIRNSGMRTTFLCTFVCYLVSTAMLFLLRPENRDVPVPPPDGPDAAPVQVPAVTRAGRLLTIAVLFACFHLLIGIGQNYIAMYLQDTRGLQLGSIGLFGSAGAIGGFLCAPLIGRLRDRRGSRRALTTALILVALAYGGLLVVAAPAAIFAVLVLRGGENGIFSLGQAEIASRASTQGLGRTFAVYNVLTGIGGTVGPYTGGLLYGLDVRLPFVAVVAGCLLVAALAWRVLAPRADLQV